MSAPDREMKPCIRCGAKDRNKSGECRPCKKSRDAERYANNPAKIKSKVAEYRATYPDRVRKTKATYRAFNKEHEAKSHANWRAKNREATRIHHLNRRVRKRAVAGVLSSGLTEKLFKLQRGKCACGCKQPLGDDYHLDHRMPLALGGTNTDDNMQLLRAKCNLKKHAKHPADFMRQQGFLL